jgi:hypothetical protein
MRRARTINGSDFLETNSLKDMKLGHPSRKRSLTLVCYSSCCREGVVFSLKTNVYLA